MARKLTIEKLEEWISDEEMAASEYSKYGLHDLADDEKRHAKFLRDLIKIILSKSPEIFVAMGKYPSLSAENEKLKLGDVV